MSIDLRALVFLDSLQPQMASFLATTARGYLPTVGQSALLVEIAPGIAINRITDVALKKTRVKPGIQVVERAYGLLEIHDDDQAEVTEAGRQILAHLEMEESDRMKPRAISSQVITNVDDHQTMLINKTRYGNMILAGQTLYILETHPAGYASLAANEAEKAADVNLVDLRTFGAFGRLYMAGSEAAIQEARKAAETALAGTSGRPHKKE